MLFSVSDRTHSESSDPDAGSSQLSPLTKDQLQQAMLYLIKVGLPIVLYLHPLKIDAKIVIIK